MIDFITHSFTDVTTRLYELVVQPLLFRLDMGLHSESAFEGTQLFLLGVLELLALWLVLGIAEKLFPVQKIANSRAVLTDVAYTLLHKLGLFTLALFFLLDPAVDWLRSQLLMWGWQSFQIESLWPAVTGIAWVSLVLYILIFDFIDYWLHRAQHRVQAWWQLHAIHHSQRDMTMWSDHRNHLLDSYLRDALFAIVGLLIGIAPSQFLFWIVLNRSLQTLQHANVRWHFGAVGERILVSPSFHRLHHAIGFGHEGRRFGCNFGVLFTFWDQLFGTADFRRGFVPTGIRDQLSGVDYGTGFWRQQWLGLKRALVPSSRGATP